MWPPGYFAPAYWAPEYWPPGDGEAPPVTQPTGGKSRRRRYPRRVYIEDTVHWVRNAEEERQLLRAYIDALKERQKAADTPAQEKRAIRLVIRAEKRLAKVDGREQEHLERLLREDEEILLLLQ